MEFKRLDKRKGSGTASIRSRYAYLIHLPDIEYFPPTNDKGVRLEGDIVLQEGRTMIPVYLTNPSQEYSYDTPGNDDEKTFLVKFVGTHPGTELEALEFSKNLLEEPFLVLIPGCEKNAPGKLLGQPNNPLIFTSTHKASKEGDKFNFNFEQRVGSEYIYFSYGGIINLPPSEDGPPSDPGTNNGFDPTKWARIDASNIDDHIAEWRAKLNIQQTEDRVLTIGTISATTTTLNLALHASGVNSVLMSGVVRSKTEDDDFTFAPVSAGKLKYVLLYSLPDPQLFHIIEGVEGNEAVYPDLPPGALLIKAVLISEFGALLEDADGGYKPLAEDPWRNIVINSNAAVNIIVASSPSASFNVLVGAGVTSPKIAAIKTKVKKNTRDGQEITFYNDSDIPVALLAGDYEETLVYTTFPFEEAYELKPRSFGKFKRKNNKYKELPAGGGKASEVENDSFVPGVSVKDALENLDDDIAIVEQEVSENTAAIETINNKLPNFLDKILATAQSVASFVTFTGNFRAKRHYYSVDETPDASPLKDWTDGVRRYFTNSSGVSKQISFGTVFIYTPTGNFALSAVKNALEAQGMIFNDSHIIVNLATNNYTCSIDIGSVTPNTLITIGKRGTGSINFTATRTLNSGVESIVILSGNDGSMAKVEFGTSSDILTIINL